MNILDAIKGYATPDLIAKAASYLGESESATRNGLGMAVPTLLGGILNSSSNQNTMSSIWNLINHKDNDDNLLSNLGGLFGGGHAATSESGIGGQLLNTVFGKNMGVVNGALSAASGLSSGSASKLISMAAPLIMGFLGKKVKSEGLGMSGLFSWLGGYKDDIMKALPAGIGNVMGFSAGKMPTMGAPTSSGGGNNNMMMWIIAALAGLGLLWFAMRGCKQEPKLEEVSQVVDQAAQAGTAAVETATNAVDSATAALTAGWKSLGDMMDKALADGTTLKFPANGVEGRIIAFIEDKTKVVDKKTWFDFDRILFETGSDKLNPISLEQIKNIAAILKAYPNVNFKIGGYTDTTGDPKANVDLSYRRASSVKAELINLGVDGGRLDAEGYGGMYPVADNATEEGRAKNRRVSLRVTKK